ncbi:MAG: hypothetical protein KJ574_01440, partial [Nanoarchaeota archaeon]|nr:hypothetical protein [Nanoarchaeota archaeon]
GNNRRVMLDIKASLADCVTIHMASAKNSAAFLSGLKCERPMGVTNEGEPVFREGINNAGQYIMLHTGDEAIMFPRSQVQMAATICTTINDFHNLSWVYEVTGRQDFAIRVYEQVDKQLGNLCREAQLDPLSDDVFRSYGRSMRARLNAEKAGLFLNAAHFAKEVERYNLAEAYEMIHQRVDPKGRSHLLR